ncbi:TetR/AcrR family transcriptional regulator [Amycolatopsis sp. CA-230715]|uniref:TetR/AcrR family transcriptional regulator n=1 Tax=Amycolatopsis sp. CA-230715 TaxID=2745196 RepID=UPI001C02BB49|nr:TetR/AcrR family transcriptional regulator C-terminal domain-containing protein [Amycolatopsis sp. CA-230715]QWF81207.1 hypothetical protein HUW46_04633 [Amycolatopsis sp. CA-230715]
MADTDLLWNQRADPPKPARLALTVDRIAEAALALADAEGIESVSMQQAAARLDVTKMALYRHVANKAQLLGVMTELAIGPAPDLAGVRGGWRGRLVEWCRLMRETWQRHPWLPTATVGDRPTGPREVAWTESAVAALEGTGLTGGERMDAVFLLSGHLRNTHSQASGGTQPWLADRSLRPLVAGHPELFPALVKAASEVDPGVDGDEFDHGWQFGLDRILDGLAAVIKKR